MQGDAVTGNLGVPRCHIGVEGGDRADGVGVTSRSSFGIWSSLGRCSLYIPLYIGIYTPILRQLRHKDSLGLDWGM